MIKGKIHYVGVNDRNKHLFEGMWPLPYGVSYNSYLIDDETVALVDTVDACYFEVYLRKIKSIIGERPIQYLIINHMEPDHSASIPLFLEKYPDAQVVATAQAFRMMGQYFSMGDQVRQVAAANGGKLELGRHTLNFVYAPMVHWPEVMMTYESGEKVLFSADGFGKFGALDVEDDWAGEARRYYIGIVGKYGPQVQKVLKAAGGLDIQMICPLHGPVLKENLGYYLDLYDAWSSYKPESEGVTVAYASAYGHTREAALFLAEALRERGTEVAVYDLARDDMAAAVADAFRCRNLVLACNTYNTGINPFMNDFIIRLVEHCYQNRRVALIENGSWAPMAAKVMRGMLEKGKDITFAENQITILSSMKPENEAGLKALAEEIG